MAKSDVNKALILTGGPDAERDVSLRSATTVHTALNSAGVDAALLEIEQPSKETLSALLEEHGALGTDANAVVFPVIHGPWGEGGPLQRLLESLQATFVGSQSTAAQICMSKSKTKAVARDVVNAMFEQRGENLGIAVSSWELLDGTEKDTIADMPFGLPFVVKPDADGSSFGVRMIEDTASWADAMSAVRRRTSSGAGMSIAEPKAIGIEFTSGIICVEPTHASQSACPCERLPLIAIKPSHGSYDTAAKYERSDTKYKVNPKLPEHVATDASNFTIQLAKTIGVRHLCRADFIYDEVSDVAWFLELNTMPGFTTSSLLPMAATSAGIDLGTLCKRLLSCAARDHERVLTANKGAE